MEKYSGGVEDGTSSAVGIDGPGRVEEVETTCGLCASFGIREIVVEVDAPLLQCWLEKGLIALSILMVIVVCWEWVAVVGRAQVNRRLRAPAAFTPPIHPVEAIVLIVKFDGLSCHGCGQKQH